MSPDQLDQADLVRQAREMYESESIQIDADAKLSEATDGIWVQAWVWVPTEEQSA